MKDSIIKQIITILNDHGYNSEKEVLKVIRSTSTGNLSVMLDSLLSNDFDYLDECCTGYLINLLEGGCYYSTLTLKALLVRLAAIEIKPTPTPTKDNTTATTTHKEDLTAFDNTVTTCESNTSLLLSDIPNIDMMTTKDRFYQERSTTLSLHIGSEVFQRKLFNLGGKGVTYIKFKGVNYNVTELYKLG